MTLADTQLRILASGILYRAALRALPRTPTAEEKMHLHARVEETAWALPHEMVAQLEGREVDDGPPEAPEWRALVERLSAGT